MNDSSDEDLVQSTQEAEATLKRKAVEEVSSDSDNELLADSQFRMLIWQGVTARNWGLYNKWNMLCIRLIDQMVTFTFIF